jgi:hypothetical protein
MRSMKINSRFRNDNLLEQKIQCYKKQNTKAIDSLSARQDSNTKRVPVRYQLCSNNKDYE